MYSSQSQKLVPVLSYVKVYYLGLNLFFVFPEPVICVVLFNRHMNNLAVHNNHY
jgi:hypothetical protein